MLTATGMYSKAANLFDSAGEFYIILGIKPKAIEYYAKVLATDPDYPAAAVAREAREEMRNETN